ncbi:MAG: class I SAM-dependent methyltransferase [Proteobacteria bacterium]|nr:class I SAM-dependent methyltransferase [Pseudomonadota bacterium]
MRERNMSELDRWEARYAVPDYVFGTEPNAFLRAQASLLAPGQKALAVADGEGRNGVWLAEQGLEVTSIEFSKTAIEKAKALARLRGVAMTINRADIAQWPWPVESFDVIAAIFIQFAAPELRRKIFAGMKRAMKHGGLLLMQGYAPGQLAYNNGGPSNPDQLWSRELLESFFSDMSSLEIREHDDVLREGARHNGKSALIDLVARK